MSLAVDPILIKKQSILSADERPLKAAVEGEACPPGSSGSEPELPAAIEDGARGTEGVSGGGGEPGWGPSKDSSDEKRSFREKILAFERFSGRRPQSPPEVDGRCQQSRSGRWTKHLPSSSSASSSSSSKAVTSSSVGGGGGSGKRDRKDNNRKNRNKNECGTDSLPVQADGCGEEVDDNGSREAAGGGGGEEGGLEKKMHWTVRLSQQLIKIRGKLEHRTRSKQRNDPEKVAAATAAAAAAAARRQSDLESKSGLAASRSSISSILHQSDSGLGNSSTSVSIPDRESLISRSCSELNRRSRRTGGVDELLLERNWNEEEEQEQEEEEETKQGCSSSRRSQSTGFLEKEEDFEEEGGGERVRGAATKTSFLSELRKFYDRNSARKSSEKRGGFFKASRKSKGVSGRIVQKQEASYIEADRIDRDVMRSSAETTTTSGMSEEATTTSGVPDRPTSGLCETLDAAAQPSGTGKESSGSKESGRKRQQVTPVPWKKTLSGISVFTGVGDTGEGKGVKVDRWENGGSEDDHLSPETSETDNFEDVAAHQS